MPSRRESYPGPNRRTCVQQSAGASSDITGQNRIWKMTLAHGQFLHTLELYKKPTIKLGFEPGNYQQDKRSDIFQIV